MTGAMYAAIGGLKTHMANLNVIGNNIANVNTAGYKDQRMTFQETIYTTQTAGSNGTLLRGGNNPSQIGYGAQVGSIDLNMSPGTFNPTGRDLDCAIDGDGFFLVGDKDYVFDTGADFTKPMLTRVGNFWVDAQGYVCDRSGNVVYGFATVRNPYYRPDLVDKPDSDEYKAAQRIANKAGYNIDDELAISSCLVPLRVPLVAAVPTKENGGIVMEGGVEKEKWSAKDPVYNFLGAVETDGTRRNIDIRDALDEANGNAKFDETTGAWTLSNGLGTTNGLTDDDDVTYDGPVANPYDKCITIDGLKVTSTGAITGTCDNGDTIVIGYAAIAKVAAPDGVTHIGGPYYKCMEGAGDINVGAVGGIMDGRYLNNMFIHTNEDGSTNEDIPGPSIEEALSPCTGTEIQGGGLEASTADVATEYSNMILTQRGYQANTRIVTVTDSMLEELINMKR